MTGPILVFLAPTKKGLKSPILKCKTQLASLMSLCHCYQLPLSYTFAHQPVNLLLKNLQVIKRSAYMPIHQSYCTLQHFSCLQSLHMSSRSAKCFKIIKGLLNLMLFVIVCIIIIIVYKYASSCLHLSFNTPLFHILHSISFHFIVS